MAELRFFLGVRFRTPRRHLAGRLEGFTLAPMVVRSRVARRPVPFDEWSNSFASLKSKAPEVDAVMTRLKRGGIHTDRILMLLWLYCSAPSQTDLRASLLSPDKQLAKLRGLILEVADQTERLNQKMVARTFLSIVQRVLPKYVLPSGLDLRTIPKEFETIPAILRYYHRALEVGQGLLKNAVADRPLFRGRVLQILYFAFKQGQPKRNPYRDMAWLLHFGVQSAGVKREMDEANLRKQLRRFKNDHPKDITPAAALAVLVNDQPLEWRDLLLAFLATKGRIRELLPL